MATLSSQVDSEWSVGRGDAARQLSRQAKQWNRSALVGGVIMWGICLGLMVIFAVVMVVAVETTS